MRTKQICLGLFLSVCAMIAPATVKAQGISSQPVTLPTYAPPAQAFTATGQTGPTLTLGGFGSGTIAVTGNITTLTWAVQGTTDGKNFFPLLTAANTAPGTTATSQTTTANSLYVVNVAGLTGIRFVTSGTFTGTGVTFKFTATATKGLL